MSTPETFNEVLRGAGLDPGTVLVLRHFNSEHPRPNLYVVWSAADGPARLNEYQSLQSQRRFHVGDYLATFADSRREEIVFIGMYVVVGFDPTKTRLTDPVYGTPFQGFRYAIDKDARLTEYEGRLLIWWDGRNFCQHAGTNDKRVRAIRPQSVTP